MELKRQAGRTGSTMNAPPSASHHPVTAATNVLPTEYMFLIELQHCLIIPR
jgi:hypothetical protein